MMCVTCGCGETAAPADRADQHAAHDHDHSHRAHGGRGHAHLSAPEHGRQVRVEQDLLAANHFYADQVRERLARTATLALNLMSSPGSGKTSLLVRTFEDSALSAAVIEGDQATARDAERIKTTGVPVVQINTGKGCHLDAHAVLHALETLPCAAQTVLFIENVGNLVCPAMFDLGEAKKVVILSVTEGDDKPLKYPHMFAVADLLLINKTDLLPHVEFDVAACVANARLVNPQLATLSLSAKTGEGLPAWLAWIDAEQRRIRDG